MLSEQEFQNIVNDFPKFEPFYDLLTHKNVSDADVISAIPEGKKCFAWFTTYGSNDVCFILEHDEQFNILNAKIILTSFNYKLAFGTILQGILFYNKQYNITCFSIDDIYHYKGNSIVNCNYAQRLATIKQLLETDMCQIALNKDFVIFGLPFMSNNFETVLNESFSLPYVVSQLKFKLFKSKKSYIMKYFKPKQYNKQYQKAIFKITPDIEPDIYNLLVYNNGKEEFYDFAFIPDFKTSVMMNKLFRKIKENDNLDLLEESDDEEEFQNCSEDKFVYLDRSFKMECEYNNKFKKWQPIKLVDKRDKITTFQQLSTLHQSMLNEKPILNGRRKEHKYIKETRVKNNTKPTKYTSYRK